MRRTILVILAVLVVVAALFIGLMVLVGSSMDGMCGVSDVRSTPSPDGKLALFVFEYDCGATTGFSTLATIQPADTKTPDASAAFFREDDQDDFPAKWQSNTALIMTVPILPTDPHQLVVNGVTVTYGDF